MGLVVDEPNELIELASGVDSFYVSGSCALPSALIEDLTAHRNEARESGSPVPIAFGSEVFQVNPRGLLRYGFRLDHSHGVVGVTTSSSLPALRVQPRAGFIHGVGVEAALAWFAEILEMVVGGPVAWAASRVDLFHDSHGWSLTADDRHRFVCRAKQLVTYEGEIGLTGFRFGAGSSADVAARIYDKTEESRAKGSDWWPRKWGAAYRPGERVIRVEFQVGRGLIRQIGLHSPEDVLADLPRLWAYLSDHWLSFRLETNDETRSRWPVAPEWRSVQAATLRGDALGLDRVYAGQRAGSLRQLLPSLRGYMASAGALVGASSLEETLSRVGRALAADEERSGIAFASRVAEKRLELRIA
jgi:hypothetical protein